MLLNLNFNQEVNKMTKIIKTHIVIFFIFVFNLNPALSSEPKNEFLLADEFKEFQSNSFLKSKFFIESMSSNKNQFIFKGNIL